MPRFLKSTLFSLGIALFLALPSSGAFAQSVPGISDPITYNLTPDFPAPQETVYIDAQSFSTDLDKAIFKWTVNGKPYKEGVGLKEISLQTGKAGALTVVTVDVATSDFGVLHKTFSFRPAGVTLLWQADTYVPPFYQGKALHAYNGSFKVTAIPEFIDAAGKRVNPKDLIYTWKKDGDVQADASGFGKDYFITSQTSYLRQGEDISVDVSSAKESMAGTASITVVPSVPEIDLYEDSPLYGVLYNKSVRGTFNLSTQELSLKAEPYNMSASAPLSDNLSFDWTINGASVPDFADKSEITLRSMGGAGGQSNVGVVVQHRTRVLQGGKASLTIFQ